MKAQGLFLFSACQLTVFAPNKVPCKSTICARQIKMAHQGSSALAHWTIASGLNYLYNLYQLCVHLLCFLIYREIKSTTYYRESFDYPPCQVFVFHLYGMELFVSKGGECLPLVHPKRRPVPTKRDLLCETHQTVLNSMMC